MKSAILNRYIFVRFIAFAAFAFSAFQGSAQKILQVAVAGLAHDHVHGILLFGRQSARYFSGIGR